RGAIAEEADRLPWIRELLKAVEPRGFVLGGGVCGASQSTDLFIEHRLLLIKRLLSRSLGSVLIIENAKKGGAIGLQTFPALLSKKQLLANRLPAASSLA